MFKFRIDKGYDTMKKTTTNRFLQFFQGKEFRSNTLKYLNFRLRLLPGIRNVLSWWFAFKYAMRTKDLTPWEQHVEKMNLERTSRKITFMCRLITLYAYITAQDEYRDAEEFQIAKSEVLQCEYWRDLPELSEFKKWIENVTPDERNGEPIKDVLDKYNKPE